MRGYSQPVRGSGSRLGLLEGCPCTLRDRRDRLLLDFDADREPVSRRSLTRLLLIGNPRQSRKEQKRLGSWRFPLRLTESRGILDMYRRQDRKASRRQAYPRYSAAKSSKGAGRHLERRTVQGRSK